MHEMQQQLYVGPAFTGCFFSYLVASFIKAICVVNKKRQGMCVDVRLMMLVCKEMAAAPPPLIYRSAQKEWSM
jgi:hypothetical protein